MTARSDNTAVLEALAQLELKLTTLISAAIGQIKDEHARALLEQAKLNATFAHRDAVENVRRQVDAHAGEIVALHSQDRVSAEDRADLRAQLKDLAGAGPQRSISNYDRWTGYLISGSSGVAAGLVAYLLTHGAHP